MYNALLKKEENEAIAERAKNALEYVREHGEFPRGLKVWELLALKELMAKDEAYPYFLQMSFEGGGKRGKSGAH